MRSFSSLPPSWLGLPVALLACAGLLAQAPAKAPVKPAVHPAASTDPIVVSVGTDHIRASQFSELLKQAPPENQAAMMANKRAVAEDLGKMLALVQEAQRQGLDQSLSFRTQMLLARDQTLAKAVVDKLQADATPTDAQIQAYYAAHTAEFGQTKLRHILVGDNESQNAPNPRTQAEALAKANALEAKLKAGASFADVAKSDSDDPGSKDNGGELGEMSPGQTVPEFESAVATLPIGKISDPIHTRFGYHIVEVESRGTMSFDQAKSMIAEQLTGDAVTAKINQIAANAHVVISDAYFGPATPAAPPTTPHP